MSNSYCKRVWLNSETKASTGSVVAFYGETTWGKETEVTTFLEVADCHEKIRLHRAYCDTKEEFITKLDLLEQTIREFKDYLVTSSDE